MLSQKLGNYMQIVPRVKSRLRSAPARRLDVPSYCPFALARSMCDEEDFSYPVTHSLLMFAVVSRSGEGGYYYKR